MKSVLIIGANSYIGKSLHKYVSQNEIKENISINMVSAADGSWKNEDFSLYDSIIHLSGIVHRKESKYMQDIYYKVNYEMAVEVAERAKENGVKQFIFMSTAAVYGKNATCITSNTVPNPTTLYGKSKFNAEQAIIKLQEENFRVAIVRAPMVYGQGCKGNYPRLIKLAKITPIFPNIHNKRSMINIETLCAFLCRLVLEENRGLFLPQDSQYIDTCDLVVKIRNQMGKKTVRINNLNLLIKFLMKHINSINKLFGDCYFEKLDN